MAPQRDDTYRRSIQRRQTAAERRYCVDRRAAVHQHVRRPGAGVLLDGVSEDIITDLSKIAGLTVIARNS